MANNPSVRIPSIEEGEIDRDRIVDGDQVPDEFFCPICQYLLWKPRSCSSCQHLFCEKCILTWVENPRSGKKCPFRCFPFEARRCPPYVQSLLSRLNIRCRNSSFGCSQILSYDQLEHHQNVECKYLSKRCSECEKLVLCSKFGEHEQIAGLCVPCPIKCTICQNYFEKSLFLDHFHWCCQERMNELIQRSFPQENFQRAANDEGVPANPGLAFFQSLVNTVQLFEQQKRLSRLPTTLKVVDKILKAREDNCGHLSHIFLMLKFLLLNWTKIPYFILMFSIGIFLIMGISILGVYTVFCHWAYTHIYRGPFYIILLSSILSYGTSMICQFVSDKTLILFFVVLLFVWICISRGSLEMLEMNPLFSKPISCIVLCCLGLFLMKIILLLIRLYYWSMPTYVAAGFVTLFNFYFGFKIHRAYANAIATTTNPPITPV